MANNPSNIRLGACRVIWGGVNLGLTKGGVEVEVSTSTKEVTVDQFGESPVNEYITGRKVSVKCPFAETDLDTLYALMRNAGATLIDDGAKANGSITFTVQPAAADTIVIAGVTFTFRAAPTLPREVKIGTSVNNSVLNLLTSLQLSTAVGVADASYALDGANPLKINIVANLPGVAGNAITTVKTGTSATMGGATLTGGLASTRRRIEMTNSIGVSIQSSAQELILRPINRDDDDFSEDFVIPLAGTGGNLTFGYKTDDERIFNLTFNGYPNTATKLLFIYGDKRST